MRSCVGHNCGVEEGQRRVLRVRCFCSKKLLPVVYHILLDQFLKISLRKRRLKLIESVWKILLLAEFLDVEEP